MAGQRSLRGRRREIIEEGQKLTETREAEREERGSRKRGRKNRGLLVIPLRRPGKAKKRSIYLGAGGGEEGEGKSVKKEDGGWGRRWGKAPVSVRAREYAEEKTEASLSWEGRPERKKNNRKKETSEEGVADVLDPRRRIIG